MVLVLLLQRASLWLAALGACIGLGCIMLFILHQKPEGHLLSNAAIAAGFSSALVVARLIFISLNVGTRTRPYALQRVYCRPVANPTSTSIVQQRQRHR